MIDWKSTGYFSREEFSSPDSPGSGDMMDELFIRVLVQIRRDCGFPFHVNSGYRTPSHNASLPDAKPDSAHTKGLAADIQAANSTQRFAIVQSALARGIKRIGIGKKFVHLDYDHTLPEEVIWLY